MRVAAACGAPWPILAITRLTLTGEIDRPDWTGVRSDIWTPIIVPPRAPHFATGIGIVVLGYVLILVFMSKIVGGVVEGVAWFTAA